MTVKHTHTKVKKSTERIVSREWILPPDGVTRGTRGFPYCIIVSCIVAKRAKRNILCVSVRTLHDRVLLYCGASPAMRINNREWRQRRFLLNTETVCVRNSPFAHSRDTRLPERRFLLISPYGRLFMVYVCSSALAAPFA